MIDDIEVERYELSRPPAYRFEVERRTGKPGAFVETDLVDPRYVSPANVKTRLESYFQMIDQRRAAGVS